MAQTRTGKVEQQTRTGVNLDAIGLAEAPNDIGGTKLIVKPNRADKAVEDAAGSPKSDRLGINVPLKSDNVQVEAKPDKPANYGKSNCECKHCQNNRHSGDKHIINHGAYKKAEQLRANELNRVILPGDVDYVKATEPVVQSIWNRRNEQEKPDGSIGDTKQIPIKTPDAGTISDRQLLNIYQTGRP